MMLTHSPPAARAPKRRAAWIYAALLAIMALPAQAFWPFTATQENPFVGKLFVEERQEEQFTGFRTHGWDQGIAGDVFEFYSFTSPSTVTRGRGAFLIYDASGDRNRYWFPVARLVDKSIKYSRTYVVQDSISNQSYTVDAAKKLITFDSKESYVYEVSGKVITLKSDIKTKTLYEIEKPFFLTDKTSSFWSGDEMEQPSFPESMELEEMREALARLNDRIVEHHRNYFDNLIAKAKGAPAIPLPRASPSPSLSPSPSPTKNKQTAAAPKKVTREDWVDGQYHGKLEDEADGSRLNFALRLKSSGEPSGQLPSAAIVGMLEFEVVSTADMLAGMAIYDDDTQVALSGQTTQGMLTLRGILKGDRLTGSWEKQADGRTTKGTLEADRTGP